MDCSALRFYHVHDFDSRQYLDEYLSDKPDKTFEEDFLLFPIENVAKTLKLGHIKGDILIDLSIGSMIHHLYAACEFFNHIIVLKVRDRCILELKRWVDTRTGAFHWGHAAKLHTDMEGTSDQLEYKEEKVRSALQHVVKCDLEKENITEPIDLPPADCIITAGLLDAISKDQVDYIRHLRNFSRMLKPGGHLLLIAPLNATYFTIGKHRFHLLSQDEDFIKKAVAAEGFAIDYCRVKKSTAESDLVDHKAVIFISAQKKK